MTCDPQRLLNAALRQDLNSFIQKVFQEINPGQQYQHNWHIEAIAWELQRVAAGETKRLLITLPPRSLKSICASVAFPAWQLGRDPTSRIICVSYAEGLAGKLSQDCRRVMSSPWYRKLFPGTRFSPTKNTEHEFVTTRHGFRLATSVGGTLTGRGGNLIIIDDPLKPEEALSEIKRTRVNDWYKGTLYSRLDNKCEDAIILIMQRLHVEDLVGQVLEQESWVHLNLPAIAEVEQGIAIGQKDIYLREIGELLHAKREPQRILDQMKATLGSFQFSAQYQQCPVPADGEIIHWNWFETYQQEPRREPNDQIVQSWDTASKAGLDNDYSVGTTWLVKGHDYYLLDVLRVKLVYPDLRQKIITYARQYRTDVMLIEDHAAGMGLIQDLHHVSPADVPKPIPCRPRADKVTRMHLQSAKIEAGHVHLPRQARWLDAFRSELLQFPHGRHDDQVDSLSQFLTWIEVRQPPMLEARVTVIYSEPDALW